MARKQMSIGQNKNRIKMDNKGLTLLEVLISMAILGIITVSFISVFTSTNLNINFSGKKVDATVETKSILDEIRSKTTNSEIKNIDDLKGIIEAVLNDNGDYKIFNEDNDDFYKYNNKKIHCLVQEQGINIGPIGNSDNNMYKIKIILFYDNGEKNVELSTYIPIKEDENEK